MSQRGTPQCPPAAPIAGEPRRTDAATRHGRPSAAPGDRHQHHRPVPMAMQTSARPASIIFRILSGCAHPLAAAMQASGPAAPCVMQCRLNPVKWTVQSAQGAQGIGLPWPGQTAGCKGRHGRHPALHHLS